MDELAKTEARNYLSAAGFFVIAASFLLPLIANIGSETFVPPAGTLSLVFGIGLLVIATLLVVLRNRDLIAICFFTLGFIQLAYAYAASPLWNTIVMGFMLLAALVTLTSKENVKWLVFLIPLIWFVQRLVRTFTQYHPAVTIVFFGILAVLCLYYAFCCASERLNLPGRRPLTADERTDFKASGSVLGYLLFALITGGYALHYILGEAALPIATFQTIELLCAALTIFVAVLLLVVGKMRFTPIMFLLMGLTSILAMYSSGAMFLGVGILMIAVGLFAMLRKESRILPGIMLIVYGSTGFFSVYAAEAMVSAPVVSIILNAVPCLIAIYLAFVVYSQRKLPKF